MAKPVHKGKRKAIETIARKARAGGRASVMKPGYLAEIERFRLMDDDFMSKCLENAPECIELMLQIILGKKDLKVVKSQTEYPIKSLQAGARASVKPCLLQRSGCWGAASSCLRKLPSFPAFRLRRSRNFRLKWHEGRNIHNYAKWRNSQGGAVFSNKKDTL